MNIYKLAAGSAMNENSPEAELYRDSYRDAAFNDTLKRIGKYSAYGAGAFGVGGGLAGAVKAATAVEEKALKSNRAYNQATKRLSRAKVRVAHASMRGDTRARNKANLELKSAKSDYKKIRRVARKGAGKEIAKGAIKGAAKGALHGSIYGGIVGNVGVGKAIDYGHRFSNSGDPII